MEIKLLERDEIDDKRWNGCVHFAICATPYGYTWYLDNVAEQWKGLVVGKYKMVMPLVYNSKFSFSYLFQPFFTQQLGVFADVPISKSLMNKFAEAIPAEFKYIQIQLNESNYAPDNFSIEKRNNYLLDMKKPYEEIRKNYSGNLLKHLKKAERNKLRYKNNLKIETFVDFYVDTTAKKVENFSDKHKYSLLRLIYKAMYYSMGSVVGIYKGEQLVAANFLLLHPQRTINLLPCSNDEGRDTGAMAFLIDTAIRIGANRNQHFDFEGSMIDGVARFYKMFGAEPVHYFAIKRNNLPWFARIFKK